MIFIGQNHIMNQLWFVLRDLYRNKDRGANFLLKGPSGYGKTTMALAMAAYLTNGVDKFELYLYDREPFKFNRRVIFIDEIHRMKDHEILYPIMDAKTHIIILATNHDSVLPEALVNRCFEFIFEPYSDDELLLIAREYAQFHTSDDNFMKIIAAGNRNPRVIKSLLDRFSMYFSENSQLSSENSDYDNILLTTFSIKDGLDTLCRRYLEMLDKAGGIASLSMMKNILHVDEETLKSQVEPILLSKGLITITHKGRSLTYANIPA